MNAWWSDLSGAELRARLTQRGVDADLAAHLVRHRENWPPAAKAITKVLGSEPGR